VSSHSLFKHIKIKIQKPKQTRDQASVFSKKIDLEYICKVGDYAVPENINYLNKVVRALKVDEFTIIPYIYLDNEEELSIGKNKASPVRFSEYEMGESTKNN
jgi:hypothetical protein